MPAAKHMRAGFAPVFGARNALPLPVRNGGGEGHPNADTPEHLQAKQPSSPQPSPPSAGGEGEKTRARNARGFTLAEVLAALAFMAIVIPVAVQGLRVASLAGQVGQRKAVAGRIAERVLNELSVTGQLQGSGTSGVAQESALEYRWTVRAEPWPEDAMRLVTVQVTFPVQGQDYDVRVSTLMDNATQ